MTQAPSHRPVADGPPAVGSRLQEVRKAQKLSLDELSRRAGVSKSMLSEVERNQANPTVAVLWRLAGALGIDLTDLLASTRATSTSPVVERVAAHNVPVTASDDGKCTLRILGPIALAGRVEWYELTVEPGGVLASEAHDAGAREHLSVLGGTLAVQAADSSQTLKAGDCARYPADVPHSIRNPGKHMARAVLVVEHLSEPPSSRQHRRPG